MQCPVCQEVTLVMADRQGIEIDYCPRCRGVWLDRGELDKIIERSTAMSGQGAAEGRTQYLSESRDYPMRREYDDDRDYRSDDYRRRKKRGFLGELFDFD
jgi:Zn-finger nucleic acid-binding protein